MWETRMHICQGRLILGQTTFSLGTVEAQVRAIWFSAEPVDELRCRHNASCCWWIHEADVVGHDEHDVGLAWCGRLPLLPFACMKQLRAFEITERDPPPCPILPGGESQP